MNISIQAVEHLSNSSQDSPLPLRQPSQFETQSPGQSVTTPASSSSSSSSLPTKTVTVDDNDEVQEVDPSTVKLSWCRTATMNDVQYTDDEQWDISKKRNQREGVDDKTCLKQIGEVSVSDMKVPDLQNFIK